VLRTYDATALDGTHTNGDVGMKPLWESASPGNPKPGDVHFTFDKFCPPVAADGKVLLATYDGRILIYGLQCEWLPNCGEIRS